ncbi:MAG: pilus assembly protein PilP [Thermodesulfobacteriota bacterium]|nr:pilus assembly protein PilP [Thermodesulfobacteriota bacterium]
MMMVTKKIWILFAVGLIFLISAACEQKQEKSVKTEPEVVVAKIPERVEPVVTKAAEKPDKTANVPDDNTKNSAKPEEIIEKTVDTIPEKGEEKASSMELKPSAALDQAKALKDTLNRKPVLSEKTAPQKNVKIHADIPVKDADKPVIDADKPVIEVEDKPVDADKPVKDVPDRKSIKAKTGIPAYVSKGRVDPFAPLIKTEKQAEAKAKEGDVKKAPERILTPLEKLDYSQMKLVAIVGAESGNMAMVEELGGKGYIVRIGTYIGKNSGRVADIKRDRIIIQERVKNFKGNFEERSREMKLHKKE